MTEFEQEVVTGLATLQAEMREVRKTLEGVAAIDKKVIGLEHDLGAMRAEIARSRAERQLEGTELRASMAAMGRRLEDMDGRVADLTQAKRDVQVGLQWSGAIAQWAWRIASAAAGALAGWMSK
jgi:hypothetical protein